MLPFLLPSPSLLGNLPINTTPRIEIPHLIEIKQFFDGLEQVVLRCAGVLFGEGAYGEVGLLLAQDYVGVLKHFRQLAAHLGVGFCDF
jgi:hypothetical protein